MPSWHADECVCRLQASHTCSRAPTRPCTRRTVTHQPRRFIVRFRLSSTSAESPVKATRIALPSPLPALNVPHNLPLGRCDWLGAWSLSPLSKCPQRTPSTTAAPCRLPSTSALVACRLPIAPCHAFLWPNPDSSGRKSRIDDSLSFTYLCGDSIKQSRVWDKAPYLVRPRGGEWRLLKFLPNHNISHS